MMSWNVYLKNGDMYELSDKDLIHKIQNREIDIESLVKNEQMTEWQKLKDTEIYKSVAEIDVYSNTKTSDREEIKFKIKTGLAVFSFILSFFNLFIIMFISGAEKVNLADSNTDYLDAMSVTAIIIGISVFVISLILMGGNSSLKVLWPNDSSRKRFFKTDDYAIWVYINTGIKLARIAFILLCFEIVYYILVKEGVFEPLFFSEDFFKGLEETHNSYSYWY